MDKLKWGSCSSQRCFSFASEWRLIFPPSGPQWDFGMSIINGNGRSDLKIVELTALIASRFTCGVNRSTMMSINGLSLSVRFAFKIPFMREFVPPARITALGF